MKRAPDSPRDHATTAGAGLADRPRNGGFTEREFRDALGLFATGVAVVTALGRDRRKIGMTVNSFTSVSLEPPLVSFNVAKSLNSISEWLVAEAFAVNLLAENQDAVSSGFARAHADKWGGVESIAGHTSCPVLRAKLAVFECEKYACHEAGDHYIMLGKVIHFEIERAAPPLLYFGGRYRKLGDPFRD